MAVRAQGRNTLLKPAECSFENNSELPGIPLGGSSSGQAPART
jgi:hypothetical protein